MAIEYNRTMKIRYEHDERLNQKEEAKLAQQLQKKGLTMITTYWGNVPEYGYNTITKKSTSHGIYIDDELIFTVKYLSTANEIVEGLSNKFEHVRTDRIVSETTKKDWVRPKGNYLVPAFDDTQYYTYPPTENSLFNFKEIQRDNKIVLDNGVLIRIRLENDYDGMVLIFKTIWSCETVQRKETIEEYMFKFI